VFPLNVVEFTGLLLDFHMIAVCTRQIHDKPQLYDFKRQVKVNDGSTVKVNHVSTALYFVRNSLP
jgi:hypothetical protein